MIRFTQGNLLKADVEAVVNTVNTVGVMGKGIALMFKERFPENYTAYAAACKRDEIRTGTMFVTASVELNGPRWIINFPTKKHWRHKTKLEWIEDGLADLHRVIAEKNIRSIAVPPLGCGNGGLEWAVVRPMIEEALGSLPGVEVIVYEPTRQYQNVAKKTGVEKLTPARALVAEMVRRYGVLGFECSILEVQKLAWCLERVVLARGLPDELRFEFAANRFGPYTDRLTHMLDALDGSYLHCDKRLSDAGPLDTIWFEPSKQRKLAEYLASPEAMPFAEALETADRLIDGFQSPLGMEVLATVDWLLAREGATATLAGVRDALNRWPGGGPEAGARKQKLFSDRLIEAALERLRSELHAA